jgi:hypothetical protein
MNQLTLLKPDVVCLVTIIINFVGRKPRRKRCREIEFFSLYTKGISSGTLRSKL